MIGCLLSLTIKSSTLWLHQELLFCDVNSLALFVTVLVLRYYYYYCLDIHGDWPVCPIGAFIRPDQVRRLNLYATRYCWHSGASVNAVRNGGNHVVQLAPIDLSRANVASEVRALALTGRWTSQANAASLDAALARLPI